MASALDEVLSAAEFVEVDLCCEAIAAAELRACCAGRLPDRLPDNVYGWVQANPHGPHADEIELAVQARQWGARGERAARPLGGRGRPFSVAG
jgi:hypothetical protein